MNFLELKNAVFSKIQYSRPASTYQLADAINYGLTEVVNAVTESRPEIFLQEAIVTIPANTLRVPLSPFFPGKRVLRVKTIVALGPMVGNLSGTVPAASAQETRYRYTSTEQGEFQHRQIEPPNDTSEVLYDMIFLAGVPTLALAPARLTADTALVQTIYRPGRMLADSDELDMMLDQGLEAIVAYAVAWLLTDVNDNERQTWIGLGDRLRAAFVQTISKVSEQNTEGVQTALDFGDT